jgi:hypothetical protein
VPAAAARSTELRYLQLSRASPSIALSSRADGRLAPQSIGPLANSVVEKASRNSRIRRLVVIGTLRVEAEQAILHRTHR